MEQAIEEITQGKSPEEIKELILDSKPATRIHPSLGKFKELETLSMISIGLTTLEGFPHLPKLQKVSRTLIKLFS
jgi:Leucine-rich repeat (LRR) protein